ncbi:hypothetical protein ACHAXT_004985 [Thalassiosira profunda]
MLNDMVGWGWLSYYEEPRGVKMRDGAGRRGLDALDFGGLGGTAGGIEGWRADPFLQEFASCKRKIFRDPPRPPAAPYYSSQRRAENVKRNEERDVKMGRGRNGKEPGMEFVTEDRNGTARDRLARKQNAPMIRKVQEPIDGLTRHGHLYTKGVAGLQTPRIEFISLNVAPEDMARVEDIMIQLIRQIRQGCVFVNDDDTHVTVDGDDHWWVTPSSSNKDLLKWYATECDKDVTLLVLAREGDTVLTVSPAPREGRKKHIYTEHALTEPHARYQTDHCDGCGAKNEDGKELLTCSRCYSAMFCCAECQRAAWSGHKRACLAARKDIIKETWKRGGSTFSSTGEHVKVPIQKMVHSSFNKHPSGLLPQQRGFFIRHLNGNFQDNAATNLADCHPYDAFTNPEWEVDWWAGLSKDQRSFVKKNMGAFANAYEPQRHRQIVSHDEAFELLTT